jgi:hypothetical protein
MPAPGAFDARATGPRAQNSRFGQAARPIGPPHDPRHRRPRNPRLVAARARISKNRLRRGERLKEPKVACTSQSKRPFGRLVQTPTGKDRRRRLMQAAGGSLTAPPRPPTARFATRPPPRDRTRPGVDGRTDEFGTGPRLPLASPGRRPANVKCVNRPATARPRTRTSGRCAPGFGGIRSLEDRRSPMRQERTVRRGRRTDRPANQEPPRTEPPDPERVRTRSPAQPAR